MGAELTQTENLLAKYLSMTGISSKDAAQIYMLLQEELDQLSFLEWLINNLDASLSDMLKMVVQIRTGSPPSATPTE